MVQKKIKLKPYPLHLNTGIGGWYLPPKICDDLITLYKKNPKFHSAGDLASDPTHLLPGEDVKPAAKIATELVINPDSDHPTTNAYFDFLQQIISLYEKRYPEVHYLYRRYGMVDPCQIQYYKPEEGFYTWHCERTSRNTNRCLVFMTYLNNVKDGGTDFKYQKLTTPAKKGLTLMWPTDFTHTHRGQISKKHEKYIITGWLGFI